MKKLWGLFAAIVMILFSILLFFLMFNVIIGSIDLGEDGKDPVLEKGEKGTVVSESVVPKTFDERLSADPLALLPSRVDDLPTGSAPSAEEKKIMKRVARFLRQWETYSPLEEDEYTERLSRQIDFDFSQPILDRVDSLDDVGVCRSEECQIGTEWVDGGPGGFTLGDWSGQEAYVYGYGIIEYDPSVTWDSRAGSLAYRAYGILLRKDDDRWLVVRAAAETEREVSS